MSDNTVILEVKDLHKSYGDHEVLKGISTTIKKGDVLALIGPSGCGKSTFPAFSKSAGGSDGVVMYCSREQIMTDASVDINHVREKIGMVFQQFNLFPNMTIRGKYYACSGQTRKNDQRGSSKKRAMDLVNSASVWPTKRMPIRRSFPVDRSSVLPSCVRLP